MTVALLICHGLLGVALLGALTHQTASLCLPRPVEGKAFAARYARVDPSAFCTAVIVLYVATFILGSVIYPAYRLDVRIPLEEMRLGWALGLFEMKEHFGGIGLAALPLYAYSWKAADNGAAVGRIGITALLAFITWFDFLVGHVLNNLRGL